MHCFNLCCCFLRRLRSYKMGDNAYNARQVYIVPVLCTLFAFIIDLGLYILGLKKIRSLIFKVPLTNKLIKKNSL